MLLATILALIGAYNLDCILSGETARCTISIPILIQGLFHAGKVRLFFLLFLAAGGLFISWAVLGQEYIKYKSDMRKITPDIMIPAPEGQGQYGTAKFLDPKQYDKYWCVAEVDVKPQDCKSNIDRQEGD